MLDVNACSLVFYKAEPDTSGKTLTPSVRGAAPRWRRRRGQRPVRRSGRADRAGRWHWALASAPAAGTAGGLASAPGGRRGVGWGRQVAWRGRRPRARRDEAAGPGRRASASGRCPLSAGPATPSGPRGNPVQPTRSVSSSRRDRGPPVRWDIATNREAQGSGISSHALEAESWRSRR